MSTAQKLDPPKRRYTPDEYLRLERDAEQKHEYFEGKIFAMAGGTARHNLIAGNMYSALRREIRKRNCQAFVSDMKVRISESDLYTYPDVAVACGEIEYGSDIEDVLLNPRVLVEVLSKSTESRDRGWKFQQYQKLPSLVDYVLVSQDQPLVERFTRQANGNWVLTNFAGLEATFSLTAIECPLTLAELYLDVEFGEEEPANEIL